MPRLKGIRRQILKKRGVIPAQQATQKRFIKITPTDREHLKTSLMRVLELTNGAPIEHLLLLGGVRQVARRLGVSPATVSKWIHRLELSYDYNHLPNCSTCTMVQVNCYLGDCMLLRNIGRLDLLSYKREEILSQ